MKNSKKNNLDINEFMQNFEHPLIGLVNEVREILKTNFPYLVENIKWNAPNFVYKNSDCITFNFPPKNDCIVIVFHRGAKKSEVLEERIVSITSKILEWKSNDRVIIRLKSRDEIENNKAIIIELTTKWLEKI